MAAPDARAVPAKVSRAGPRDAARLLQCPCHTGNPGESQVIPVQDETFDDLAAPLLEITKGRFPIRHVIRFQARNKARIVAPSYRLFPEITVRERITDAMKIYGVRAFDTTVPRILDTRRTERAFELLRSTAPEWLRQFCLELTARDANIAQHAVRLASQTLGQVPSLRPVAIP
jgi:hypothetical protein